MKSAITKTSPLLAKWSKGARAKKKISTRGLMHDSNEIQLFNVFQWCQKKLRGVNRWFF